MCDGRFCFCNQKEAIKSKLYTCKRNSRELVFNHLIVFSLWTANSYTPVTETQSILKRFLKSKPNSFPPISWHFETTNKNYSQLKFNSIQLNSSLIINFAAKVAE